MRTAKLLPRAATLVVAALSASCESADPAAAPSLEAGASDAGAQSAPDAALPDEVDGGDAGDASLLSPTYVPFDVNHVLGTGQSLSVGSRGTPALTKTQPYDNRMFVNGPMNDATGLTSFVPLVEGDLLGKLEVETMSSSFANLVTREARERIMAGLPSPTSHDLFVSLHGVGGVAYAGLKKGTTPYANGIAQVTAARDLAKAAGQSYVVRAVTTVHGESDEVANNAGYAANLLEWQTDYDADVKKLTGQALAVPLFQTQMSSWTKYRKSTSTIAMAQLAAHVGNPGRVILVGPKYHLAYDADGVHLSNAGYVHMGEDYAKAYRRVVLEGKPWEPLRPKSVARAGAEVTVTFLVPAPPLVLDETRVQDPGSFGFEAVDATGAAVPITRVALASADSVKIVLGRDPGAGGRIRYAFTGVVGSSAGPRTGARGNLRDSDATASRNGEDLFNWCVHFDEAMP